LFNQIKRDEKADRALPSYILVTIITIITVAYSEKCVDLFAVNPMDVLCQPSYLPFRISSVYDTERKIRPLETLGLPVVVTRVLPG
jgi:hypothetical protein